MDNKEMLNQLFAVYFSYAKKKLPEFSSKKGTIWSLGQGEAVGVSFVQFRGFHGGFVFSRSSFVDIFLISFRSNAFGTAFGIQIFQVSRVEIILLMVQKSQTTTTVWMCKNPVNHGDKLPTGTNWCRISSINGMKLSISHSTVVYGRASLE